MWTNALVGGLCPVCSSPMSDPSLSKSVSMINPFRNSSLSNIGIRWFLMFLRMPVIRCRLPFHSLAKRVFGIWPLSANSFPSSPATIFSRGSRSSVLPAVILIAINAPLWFITTCGLNPGNRPIVERPRAAGPLKVRLRGMRGLAQTASPVLSAIWMPVPSPRGEWIRTQNGAKGRGINATNRPYEGSSPKQSRYFCSTPYRRKCLKSLNGGRWNSTMMNSIPAGDSLPCRRRLRVAGISRCRSRSSGVSAKSSRQHNSAVADRHMGGIARVVKNTILNHTRRGRGRPLALPITRITIL